MSINPNERPTTGAKEFEEFNRLYLAHRHIFDHRKSPRADELIVFNGLLRQTPYVIAMFQEQGLQEAIDRLEKGFQKKLVKYKKTLIPVPLVDGSLPLDEEPSGEMKQATKLEREVRFVIRGAFLSRHHLEESQIFFKADQDKHRSRVIKYLESAHRELKWLVPDPFLAKGYFTPEAQPSIEHLAALIPAAIKHLRDALPQYPVQRNSLGNTKGERRKKKAPLKIPSMLRRQLLDRLFDACNRCYAYHSPEAVNLLLSCHWLGQGVDYVATWKDVEAFRERTKIVEAERVKDLEQEGGKIKVIPYEKFRFVDPWKDREPILSPLGGAEPGYGYDAPWLRW